MTKNRLNGNSRIGLFTVFLLLLTALGSSPASASSYTYWSGYQPEYDVRYSSPATVKSGSMWINASYYRLKVDFRNSAGSWLATYESLDGELFFTLPAAVSGATLACKWIKNLVGPKPPPQRTDCIRSNP